MKTYLAIMSLCLAFSACQSRAADKVPPIYLSTKLEKLAPAAAMLSAAQGSQIYKCVLSEARISKSGTSISLKNVKTK